MVRRPPLIMILSVLSCGNTKEEIIVGGSGSQQVVVESMQKKTKLENDSLAK